MNFNRPITGLMLLAGAAGGPYFLYETNLGSQARSGAAQVFGISDQSAGTQQMVSTENGAGFWNANGVDLSNPTQDLSQAESALQTHALNEVLRFDVSPHWIPQRFNRVSTVLAETQLDGLRVPLVTGTSPTDIAGTLTYYFDQYKRVQRITVHAVTGDPTRVVAELQHSFRLQQQPSLGGGLYLLKWNGRPTSVLFTAPAPVLDAAAPNARYNVFIELNQGGLEYGLSSEAQNLLNSGRSAQRWQ